MSYQRFYDVHDFDNVDVGDYPDNDIVQLVNEACEELIKDMGGIPEPSTWIGAEWIRQFWASGVFTAESLRNTIRAFPSWWKNLQVLPGVDNDLSNL